MAPLCSQGELLWCSPVQSPLMQLITDQKHEVVITADSGGLIKTWQGETGQETGSFPAASSHCSLLQYNISNAWFLTVRHCRTDHDWEELKSRRWLFSCLLGRNRAGICLHAGGVCSNEKVQHRGV